MAADSEPCTSGYVCVECGERNDSLYVRYSPSVLKLSECRACGRPVDKYVEYDPVLILLEVLLQRVAAYRHILFNGPIAGKFVWRLCVIFLLCDAYKKFKRKSLLSLPHSGDEAAGASAASEWRFYASAAETLLESAVFLCAATALTALCCHRREGGRTPASWRAAFGWAQALLLATYGNVLVVLAVVWRLHNDVSHLALTQLLIAAAQMHMLTVSSGVRLWHSACIVVTAYVARLTVAYALDFTLI